MSSLKSNSEKKNQNIFKPQQNTTTATANITFDDDYDYVFESQKKWSQTEICSFNNESNSVQNDFDVAFCHRYNSHFNGKFSSNDSKSEPKWFIVSDWAGNLIHFDRIKDENIHFFGSNFLLSTDAETKNERISPKFYVNLEMKKKTKTWGRIWFSVVLISYCVFFIVSWCWLSVGRKKWNRNSLSAIAINSPWFHAFFVSS